MALQNSTTLVGLNLLVLFLYILQKIAGVYGALDFQCPSQNMPPAGNQVPIPKLPPQFTVQVEANIVNKQMTVEAQEAYDFPNKRAAMSITTNNGTVLSIFDYTAKERLDILANGTCLAKELSDSSFDAYGFTEMKKPGQPTIMSAADVFRFGEKVDKTFLGEGTVRGIAVYHWQSCQSWQSNGMTRAAYVMDFYFSKPDYTTASLESNVPVRVVINGSAINVDSTGQQISGSHNFSHVYDFSFFRAGPVEDEWMFEVPRGSVCRRKLSKTMPQLPDQFSLSMEVKVADSPWPPMTERMLFDYDYGLIQVKRFAPRGRGMRFGLTELTVVEDYTNRVQYVVDSFDGNCSVRPLPDGLSTSSGGGEGAEITMRHGQQLLNYARQDFRYQGQRRLREARVDVWAAAGRGGMVQEVYFLADWPTRFIRSKLSMMNSDADLARMYMLVGTYLANTTAINSNDVSPLFRLFGDRAIKPWSKNWQAARGSPPSLPRPGQLLRQHTSGGRMNWRRHLDRVSEKFINIFNYIPMHMDLSAFDVSMCYQAAAKEIYVFLLLEGTYAAVVADQRYSFMSSARAALAKAAGVSPLRIAKVNVWQDMVSNHLNFFFSLLQPPPLPGPGPSAQPSSQEAFDQLSASVKAGMSITINHPLRKTSVNVVSTSLKKWNSLDELWSGVLPGKMSGQRQMAATQPQRGTQGAPEGDAQSSGYSKAEFGGMAFGMLVIGIFVGVLGLYIAVRKLRPDIQMIPYQQSK